MRTSFLLLALVSISWMPLTGGFSLVHNMGSTTGARRSERGYQKQRQIVVSLVRRRESETDERSSSLATKSAASARASSTWKASVGSCLLGLLLPPMLWLSQSTAVAAATKPLDISNQDFSGKDLSNKDFRLVTAKSTNFDGANLQGSSFQKALLDGATFAGADIRGASFEDAVLDNASFKDANAIGSKFGPTILDAGNLEGIDMNGAIFPSKYRTMICEMPELKGSNPTTGADTRRSIFCEE